ncbi:DegV family protein [Symbiobacterium terraclitae]|uniref:DegV family protein n=1 Tax=Symbiobacterium terraclitae TaxID=557451 RepID=UPI0035B533B6
MSVRIVTDSTAGVPADLCRELSITVVPVPIFFGSTVYRDGVDDTARFYALLAGDTPPSTSTPAPAEFEQVYRELTQDGDQVLSIHLMESKSGLINAARMAAAVRPAGAVQVVDSGTTSLALGLMVVAAARAALEGAPLSQIAALVERLRERAALHAAIPQLTQLRRSGRVSLSKSLLAGLLAIKPVLYIGQSVIEVVATVRGWSQAVERMVSLAQRRAQGHRVHLAVVHTNAPAEAHRLMAAIRDRFDCVSVLVAEAGPALAAHAGAGALGVATLAVDGSARTDAEPQGVEASDRCGADVLTGEGLGCFHAETMDGARAGCSGSDTLSAEGLGRPRAETIGGAKAGCSGSDTLSAQGLGRSRAETIGGVRAGCARSDTLSAEGLGHSRAGTMDAGREERSGADTAAEWAAEGPGRAGPT